MIMQTKWKIHNSRENFQTLRLIDEQVTRNRKSVKLQAFIDEIKNADTLNLDFNDRL